MLFKLINLCETNINNSGQAHGGYYKATPVQGLTVISINTVIYSRWHRCDLPQTWNQTVVPGCADAGDPFGQFKWLREELRAARQNNTAVWIFGHIPPTIGSYLKDYGDIAKRGTGNFWREHWSKEYHEIVREYGDVVRVQLFGHLHSEEFRVFPEDSHAFGSPPILLSPAVTPAYNNNPSFKILEYDSRSMVVMDYKVHAAPLPLGPSSNSSRLEWKELFSARDMYDVANLTTGQLLHAAQRLVRDDAAWDKFFNVGYRTGVVQSPCNAACRRGFECTFVASNTSEYKACIGADVNTTSPASSPTTTSAPTQKPSRLELSAWLVFGSVFGSCGVLCTIALFVHFHRHKDESSPYNDYYADPDMANNDNLDLLLTEEGFNNGVLPPVESVRLQDTANMSSVSACTTKTSTNHT